MIRAGQKLREERLGKGLSLAEVEKGTKIKASFLEAIEKGEYQKLPSSAYAQGFVRNYAEFLNLPSKEILAIFRREFDERNYIKVLPESFARGKDMPGRKIRIQQKLLVALGIILVFIAFIIYQYRYAFINPPLHIDEPIDNKVTGKEVTVTGHTDPNTSVTVNDLPVALDTNGDFIKKITLFPGDETITIKSVSRFGKQTIVERKVTVKE